MLVELEKVDLLRLLKTIMPMPQDCVQYSAMGFMTYKNENGDHWEWSNDGLSRVSEDLLWKMYEKSKRVRN